jgi:hypothetical protein
MLPERAEVDACASSPRSSNSPVRLPSRDRHPRQRRRDRHDLDPEGLKVDGVSYTAADVHEGWTLTF